MLERSGDHYDPGTVTEIKAPVEKTKKLNLPEYISLRVTRCFLILQGEDFIKLMYNI